MATREKGGRDYYDDPGFNYARWWAGRGYEHHAEVMAIRRLLQGRWFARAVDVGGGFGRLSTVLAEFADEVTLTDSSVQQLEISREFLEHHPHITGRQMPATELDFPAASVGLAAMIRVMHHLPEPEPALAEIARVLKPGGCAVIEVANSAHAINRLRYLARRQPVPPGACDVGLGGEIPFVNHHPDTVALQFRAAGLRVRRTLSVSNFRHPVLKQVIPARALLAAERVAQERLARARFGPSLVFLLEK
ncbi:MAG TPA: methyltransferase domain-containing protein [Streptosporangiaceae bacterium]|jgi:ubiquinone/menaquinone biosynthesis C-methylase UbiE